VKNGAVLWVQAGTVSNNQQFKAALVEDAVPYLATATSLESDWFP